MQKVLGQDIKDLEERKNFLIDNADGVEEMDYHKSYESEEFQGGNQQGTQASQGGSQELT